MPHSCKLPVKKQAQQKYHAIVRASVALFLKHGYTRTSMDAVAQAANVSKQTVYSYFKNKDDLFCKMIESECARHSPSDKMLDDPKLKPDDALFCIGRGFIEMISSPRGIAIHRLVMAEAERHPQIAKLFYESGPLRMQALLVHYLEHRGGKFFTINDVNMAASYFFSLVKGRYHLRMSLKIRPIPSKKELDSHVQDVVKLFNKLYAS